MLVRRELVYDGLMLMQSCLLVRRIASEKGLTYQAGTDAAIFIGALRTEYFDALQRSASFLAKVLAQLTDQDFDALVDRQLEQWAIQFQDVTGPSQ
jgi:hypothetical protein